MLCLGRGHVPVVTDGQNKKRFVTLRDGKLILVLISRQSGDADGAFLPHLRRQAQRCPSPSCWQGWGGSLRLPSSSF